MVRLFTVITLCLFALSFDAFSREVKTINAQRQQWKKLESENREFAIALPANFDVSVEPEGFIRQNPQNRKEFFSFKDLRSIRAYEEGVAIIFERYKVEKAKRALPVLLDNEPSLSTIANGEVRDVSFENFIGRQRIKENERSYSVTLHLASDNYIYFIIVGARNKDNSSISQFLGQIEVAGKQLLAQSEKIENIVGSVHSISDLQNSPFEVVTENALEKQETPKLQAETSKNEIKSPPAPDPTAKPLVIFFQPAPGYSEKARRNNVTGKIRLRVIFRADGQINKAEVLSGLPDGLNERVFSSVRRMLFIPATKQGTPISLSKVLEYNFSMY